MLEWMNEEIHGFQRDNSKNSQATYKLNALHYASYPIECREHLAKILNFTKDF